MNTDMPVLETNFLYIKLFSVTIDNLTSQEFAFPHDSFWLLLSFIDINGYNDENSHNRQKQYNSTHINEVLSNDQ